MPTLGDVVVSKLYTVGASVLYVDGLAKFLSTADIVPNQITIYRAGNPSVSGVYAITGAGAGTISGLSFLSGSNVAWSPGDVVQLVSASSASGLPKTGLSLDQFTSKVTADTASGSTVTFDLSVSNWHKVTLDHTQTLTLAVINGTVDQMFTLELIQDGTGSCAVSWFTTIKWAGGSAPTLTTTLNKVDIFTFKVSGSGTYYGMIAGQNF